MPNAATFESFERELNRLVESFGQRLAELKQLGYAEAQLRDDFLNPFFRALGWDMENRAGLIQREREVEIESATQILKFLDEARRDLASDIYKNNDHDELLDGNRLWCCPSCARPRRNRKRPCYITPSPPPTGKSINGFMTAKD